MTKRKLKEIDTKKWVRDNPVIASRPFIKGMLKTIDKLPNEHPLCQLYIRMLDTEELISKSNKRRQQGGC